MMNDYSMLLLSYTYHTHSALGVNAYNPYLSLKTQLQKAWLAQSSIPELGAFLCISIMLYALHIISLLIFFFY